MRIGELARELGVSADTLRFYEREGWLPRPDRAQNGYRSYRTEDVEHLRLLLNLRRIDLPSEEVARLASWNDLLRHRATPPIGRAPADCPRGHDTA